MLPLTKLSLTLSHSVTCEKSEENQHI